MVSENTTLEAAGNAGPALRPCSPGASDLEERVWRALEAVKDPEIPVLDVVEMGIVRSVEVIETQASLLVKVTITPTFSACPALHEIERGVRAAATEAVEVAVEVVTTLSPPWSSDDLSDAARLKLERFGIAPPTRHGGLILPALDAPVRCPRCGYPDTRVRNTFGSTLCREIRSCNGCQETFERFKPL